MKSIVLSSVVTALLVFSGCSSKEPVVDNKTEEVSAPAAQEVQAPATETVSSENSVVSSSTENSAEMTMAEIESKLPIVYFAFDKYDIAPV